MAKRPPPPHSASRSLDDALHDLSGDFLLCRDLHHAWRVDHYESGRSEVVRVLECERCGTIRTDEWTLRGARIGARYTYPDGYALRDVGDGYDREAMRREVLLRAGIRAGRRK